jgi:WD40 repeat protein
LWGLGLAAPGRPGWAQGGEEKPAAKQAAANPQVSNQTAEKPAWREKFVMAHDHPVALLACNADWIAVADEAGNLFLWDARTGKERTLQLKGGKEKGLTTSVDRLQFMPDGKHLYAILDGGRGLCRVNLQKSDGPSGGLRSPAPIFLGVSPDGETWLEAHVAGRTLALRPNPMTPRGTAEFESVKYESEIVHAVLSADDKWLAVATADGKLHLHERSSLKETQTIDTKQRTVAGVQLSPDGSRVAVVGHDAPAKVYDVTNGNEVATLKGHSGIVFTVAFSPDGKMVATGGDDNTARIWDAATGKELAVLKGHKDSVRSVAFDPSGETLITGSADKTVKTWKLAK